MRSYDEKVIKILNNPKLAHELGIVSQMIYKNSSAHRCQKYFQAFKKIDRHMRDLISLDIVEILKDSKGEDEKLKITMINALTLLQEVERNCMETVRYCLPQLYLERFIAMHTLHINVVSNIWHHVLELTKEVTSWIHNTCENDWLELIGKPELQTNIPEKNIETIEGCNANQYIDAKKTVDIGEVVSRNELVKKCFQDNKLPSNHEMSEVKNSVPEHMWANHKRTKTLNTTAFEHDKCEVTNSYSNHLIETNLKHSTLNHKKVKEDKSDYKSSRKYINFPLRYRPYHIRLFKHYGRTRKNR